MYILSYIILINIEIFLKDEFIYPRKKLIKKLIYEIFWKKNVYIFIYSL